jgi:uncharacterized protein involved in exopolysaccharide biosynthesis
MTDGAADRAATSATPSMSIDTWLVLARRWRTLLLAPLGVGALAVAGSFLVDPTFTARTSFLTPQPQGATATALSALGPLAGLAGIAGGARTPAEQFVALLRSTTIQDRVIDRFDLMKVYDNKYRSDTRRDLEQNVRILLSRREGIIEVEVDDHSPIRAAAMANAYLEELRRLTATLTISEAQQRRAFFDAQLTQTRDRLSSAQRALQDSGFNSSSLKAEPRAAAEAYARLRAEATATQVRLQALRGSLSDDAPEVRQQLAALATLRAQLAVAEPSLETTHGVGDYVARYRDFKYHETLYELFARQYELARVDEAREGAIMQAIDVAQPPDKKRKPKRSVVGLVATAISAILLTCFLVVQDRVRRMAADPVQAARWDQFRRALRRRD